MHPNEMLLMTIVRNSNAQAERATTREARVTGRDADDRRFPPPFRVRRRPSTW